MPTETSAAAATADTKTARPTLNTFFLEMATRRADELALKKKEAPGKWADITWRAYRENARRVGLGLCSLGLAPGERVAILSNSRVEWVYADMGILGAAGVTVPIYQNVREDEVAYIVHDSGARFIFVEDQEQLAKLAKARAHHEGGGLKKLEKAIVFDAGGATKPVLSKVEGPTAPGLPDGFVLRFDELCARGEKEPAATFEQRCAIPKLDDLMTLVYTSGTTGKPKGVMLTHGNAVGECEGIAECFEFSTDDVVLSFLPLAHIFARCVHWAAVRAGFVTAYTSIASAADDMKEVRPTVLPSVPRFFEKIHAAVMQKVNAETGLKRKYVRAALAWQKEADRRYRAGQSLPLGLALRRLIAGPAVKKISGGLREKTGGRLRFFISGGAPLSREIAEFFHSLGFLILEGYGLTETTAGTHVNRLGHYKLGTVGVAVKNLETRIAPDGEILVRGPIVMKGYYNKPDATREVMDEDGFFHTGDIGEIDPDGFLRITDRKKDLIKTAGGKYVAPQNLENLMKTISGVSQIAVFGDARPYCVALVTIDADAAKRILREAGTTAPDDAKEIAKHVVIEKHISVAISEKNAELASYETVKYFRIVPKDFEVGDELTPTLKVKRKHVAEKYKTLIDEMYASGKKE